MKKFDPHSNVSAVTIASPFEKVWQTISDPQQFPTIYPEWTSEVTKLSDEIYLGESPENEKFKIKPKLSKEFGIVDFEITFSGTTEQSRSRLFPIANNKCQLVHVAVRWDGLSYKQWQRHIESTERDLHQMKRVIERHNGSE